MHVYVRAPPGKRINTIQNRRYRMFYYKITDTENGSEQFLKPSDARRFLSLEDADIIKAFPGMIPFAPGADDDTCIVETWI